MELAVDQQHLGLAVVEDEGDHRRIEPRVERIQHAARHRHAEMRLVHFGMLGAMIATVSPTPMPTLSSAEASCRQRA